MSRYLETVRRTRRDVLRGSVLASVSAVFMAACGGEKSSDAAGSSTTEGKLPTTVNPTTAAVTVPAATATPATPGPDSTVAAVVDPAAPAVPGVAAGEMAIKFAYVPSDGGRRIHNPYVAVWIENAEEQLVRTVHVTIKLGKGLKWLRDLKRWNRVDQARQEAGGADYLETVSSPTRQPGTFDLVWDGLDDNGQPLAAGVYTLYIEAAREKGPYDLITEALTLDGQPFERALDPAGDLQEVSIALAIP